MLAAGRGTTRPAHLRPTRAQIITNLWSVNLYINANSSVIARCGTTPTWASWPTSACPTAPSPSPRPTSCRHRPPPPLHPVREVGKRRGGRGGCLRLVQAPAPPPSIPRRRSPPPPPRPAQAQPPDAHYSKCSRGSFSFLGCEADCEVSVFETARFRSSPFETARFRSSPVETARFRSSPFSRPA